MVRTERGKLTYAARLDRVTLHNGAALSRREYLTHYRNVFGQRFVHTLCGWEGGTEDRDPAHDDRSVDCPGCLAIVAFFDSARKGRTGGDNEHD